MANPYEGTIFEKVLHENMRTNWGKNPEKVEEGDEKNGRKDEEQSKAE
ncbi:hypothetical protein IJ103_00950 [Candidatus Saccharibacteria bacterium]|nr:hypothetical protein [Candidatus Saccharibacteria bacterium]MBQ9016800.1 hypothetical protein [Candidatus Saccharibacteria bacterium]